MRRVVVLGATKGIGRALARRLVARGDQLFLLGRDLVDVQRSAADLAARSAGFSVGSFACDLAEPQSFAPALEAADQALGGFDTVVLTAAQFATQEKLEADAALLQQLLTVNFTHTVLFCELARQRLLARGGGTLCVFSSVAGDRSRKPVVLYGATKAGLDHYLEGLDHRFHQQGLRVVCVKPGFVRTAMTAGLKEPPFASTPERVAADVARAIEASKPVLYTPLIWWLVMGIIRRVPRWVMRRIGF